MPHIVSLCIENFLFLDRINSDACAWNKISDKFPQANEIYYTNGANLIAKNKALFIFKNGKGSWHMHVDERSMDLVPRRHNDYFRVQISQNSTVISCFFSKC